MLLDLYLFFCMPFPQPQRAEKRTPGRRVKTVPRKAARKSARKSARKGARATGRSARSRLRVIEGGRAGVP